jgi:ATP-dependent exoDNAse (exonuclease V) beta subunit
LRTLYVACTRAEDYLILSASLPDPFKPTNAWMLLLSERFDLASGDCLDAGIPKEQRPAMTVTQELPSADRPARVVVLDDVEDVDQSSAGPLLPCVTEHDGVTVAGLEAWLRGRRDPAVTTLTDAPANLGLEPAEARRVLHDLEYVLKGSTLANATPSLFAATELPALQGVIDCLWQDAEQRWHLAGWRNASRTLDEERRRLAVAAQAVSRHTGQWPASVSLAGDDDAKPLRFSEKELRHPKLLAEIERALTEMMETRS